MGEVKKINLGAPSYFYELKWSPDSKKIAYRDKRLNIWYVDIEKGTPVKIDTNMFENPFSVNDFDWVARQQNGLLIPNNSKIVYAPFLLIRSTRQKTRK